jgi:hypothetical protein
MAFVSWLIYMYIYLVTYIWPTKFSEIGFCPTKSKLCPTKIKSDRTNILSSQIFICSPGINRLNYHAIRPYSKSSLTLNEWRFNLSFSLVSVLFLNSWRSVSYLTMWLLTLQLFKKTALTLKRSSFWTSTHWVWVWVSF